MGYKKNTKKHTEKNIFLDENVDIQRFDVVKYKSFDKLTNTQLGFFWRPEEVSLLKDKTDVNNILSEHEKHIFISNIKMQTFLDSIQGSTLSEILLPIVSLPEVQNFIVCLTSFEGNIHSRSYSYILQNIFDKPDEVLGTILDNENILKRANSIDEHYSNLRDFNNKYKFLGYGTHTVNGETIVLDEYEHKKLIWLCINAWNILEGIRFYVSFA